MEYRPNHPNEPIDRRDAARRGEGDGSRAGYVTSKSSLTPPRVRLIDLMQRLNFGRIEDLHILNGEPLFDPPPRVFRDVRPGRVNGPRPEAGKADFDLKDEVIDLFVHQEAVGDGVIERIEVQHGLPFRMTFEEVYA